jgi:Fe-S cluster biogenesis protein NfuA
MVHTSASAVGDTQLSFSRRLRRRIRVRAERVLDRLGLVEPRAESVEPVAAWSDAPAASAAQPAATVQPAPASTVTTTATPGGMTIEAVQELFDDMVRPALQSDGGDISLREVVGGEVRVTLVGACSTCPSSILTMKNGIERLLEEEFEEFESLVQVDG